jgi:hypothetical protein
LHITLSGPRLLEAFAFAEFKKRFDASVYLFNALLSSEIDPSADWNCLNLDHRFSELLENI